jgi:hypothetical protein
MPSSPREWSRRETDCRPPRRKIEHSLRPEMPASRSGNCGFRAGAVSGSVSTAGHSPSGPPLLLAGSAITSGQRDRIFNDRPAYCGKCVSRFSHRTPSRQHLRARQQHYRLSARFLVTGTRRRRDCRTYMHGVLIPVGRPPYTLTLGECPHFNAPGIGVDLEPGLSTDDSWWRCGIASTRAAIWI